MSSVHLVVVHRNRGTTCRDTVHRFLQQTEFLDFPTLTVTVVDNGSTPEHLAGLRDGLAPEVEVIENGKNLGFGKNVSTKKLNSEISAIINDFNTRKSMKLCGQKLIDGNGVFRAKKLVQSLII